MGFPSLRPATLNLRAFTVYSAILAVYATDANDQPTGEPLKLLVDSLPITPQVESIPVREHGRAHTGSHQVDVAWTLELQRPRFIELTSPSAAKVQWEPERNVRYAVAVVWHDAVRGLWEKQVFTGVTGLPAALDGGNTQATIALRAERRSTSEAGHNTMPTFGIGTAGFLRYIDAGGGATTLYTFTNAGGFVAVDAGLLASRATVTVTSSQLTVQFAAAAPVLTATESAFTIGAIRESGATFGDTAPRLEFHMDGARLCTLGADGVLHITGLIEDASAPADSSSAMKVKTTDDEWLFTVGLGGLVCAGVVE